MLGLGTLLRLSIAVERAQGQQEVSPQGGSELVPSERGVRVVQGIALAGVTVPVAAPGRVQDPLGARATAALELEVRQDLIADPAGQDAAADLLTAANAAPDQKFQFERFGYFVADRVDHVAGAKPVFNRVTGLKDSWGK